MNRRTLATTACFLGAAAFAWFAYRVGTQDELTTAPGSPRVVVLPAAFFLPNEPAGALSVEDAKKSALVGSTLALRGRIGGSDEPFVDGRAVFTIVGSGIPACCDVPGHQCKTPWDYCHIVPEEIAAHSATVQFVDAAGVVLKQSVKGQHGIKELSQLVVVGMVSQTEGDTLVLNATGLYVVPQ